MQIQKFSDAMLPSLRGFIEKNRHDLSSINPGDSLTLFISQTQIKGLLKDIYGNNLKLKKVVIKYK
jgi:hypothetical protein